MGSAQSGKTNSIRLMNRFSEAFNQFQEQIRERAYHLSLGREPADADPMLDWLEAEAELSQPLELEVKQQGKNTVLEVKLKDFTPEEIEIEVVGNVLQIFGSRSETTPQKKSNGIGSISKAQSFFHSVPLNTPVDIDHSHAKLFKNGKLKVVLPKKAEHSTT